MRWLVESGGRRNTESYWKMTLRGQCLKHMGEDAGDINTGGHTGVTKIVGPKAK